MGAKKLTKVLGSLAYHLARLKLSESEAQPTLSPFMETTDREE